MPHDDLFRLLSLLLLAVVMPIAMYYRFRSFTSEKLDRWQEGVWILFGLRLSGIPSFLGGVAWLIEPRWMAWASLPLPVWLRGVGIGLGVCTGVLLAWTFHHLGRNLTDTVVTRADSHLVTSGPYRYVRHPFYVAFALGVLGFGLAAANWFLLVSACLPLAFIVARTRIEEAKLVERFGDEYRQYMRRVGRFWPRVDGLERANQSNEK